MIIICIVIFTIKLVRNLQKYHYIQSIQMSISIGHLIYNIKYILNLGEYLTIFIIYILIKWYTDMSKSVFVLQT